MPKPDLDTFTSHIQAAKNLLSIEHDIGLDIAEAVLLSAAQVYISLLETSDPNKQNIVRTDQFTSTLVLGYKSQWMILATRLEISDEKMLNILESALKKFLQVMATSTKEE